MYGFGEQMRQVSLHFVPTAILSRQVAVVRNDCLIINLPGQPKAIKETLEGVKDKDGNVLVKGIFQRWLMGWNLSVACILRPMQLFVKVFAQNPPNTPKRQQLYSFKRTLIMHF